LFGLLFQLLIATIAIGVPIMASFDRKKDSVKEKSKIDKDTVAAAILKKKHGPGYTYLLPSVYIDLKAKLEKGPIHYEFPL